MPGNVAEMSHQHQPLDKALGTVGNVRILRILAFYGGALPASRLAAESRLSLNGTLNALSLLEETGAVTHIGSGRMRLYRLATERAMGAMMGVLFAAERKRFDDMLEDIKEATNLPGVIATWLFGSVARWQDHMDSDVDIAVLIEGPDEHVTRTADAVRDRLGPVGERMTCKPSVISLSFGRVQAMIASADPLWDAIRQDSMVLSGKSPFDVSRQVSPTTKPE